MQENEVLASRELRMRAAGIWRQEHPEGVFGAQK
jgi:hypothetical protein